MIRQKDYQWEAAIKIAKEDGADYVAILLGRLRDAQKEIEALEAAQQRTPADFAICAPELHAMYDENGDLYCRHCGKPLSR